MATHFFDTKVNAMRPIPSRSTREVTTSFLILREGKVIFDGTASELGRTDDEYIKEYIA